MTSSLVGSEMCIRDSSNPTPVTAAASQMVYWSTGCHSCPPMAVKDGQWPVSYTHLTLPTICSV
eukprot:12310579-Prorocentrum_lima.AAC.1